MRRLIIKNIGPLNNVIVTLSKINLIIGPQSTGKSCILKIESYCAWVEKAIELSQTEERYLNKVAIETNLINYHNLQDYITSESYFGYETDTMIFSYSFNEEKPSFNWKEIGQWTFKRSKISYVPAERNIISIIPNWLEVKFPNNYTRGFIVDWRNVQNYMKGKTPIQLLNTGVSYIYDSEQDKDIIILNDGKRISLQHSSSGFQSLTPLVVYVSFLTKGIFYFENESTIDIYERKATVDLLYKIIEKESNKKYISFNPGGIGIGDDKTQLIINNFTKYDHSDIYLEEPEENLFPETQRDLVNWLVETVNGERNHSLFIATHSPYIMSAFNNLIQAGDIIEESPEKEAEVEKILGGHRAIKYDDVAAFAISDGSVHSIKDDELRLISPSELDTVSDDISNVFNQLIAL